MQPEGRSIVHSCDRRRPLTLDEARLIARLRARDLDALGELYRQLGGAMLTLARSMMRDRDEADDIVADTLLKIHDAAPGFRGERGLKTWVLRIVANRCRDLLRRRRFDAGKADEMDPIAHSGLRVDPGEGWDDALDKPALYAALERAIDELPAEQREAVIMKERLGLSVLETADALNISESAVKSRLFRARAVLLEKLRGWESDRPR